MPEQNFERAFDVFKQMYLEPWRNMLNTEPAAISSRIKNIQITGSEGIHASSRVGFNGGFASMPDDMKAPQAGRNLYQRFKETERNMAVALRITDKAIKASNSDAKAFFNLLDEEIRGAHETAKWNVGRMIFGNGLGILTPIASTAANTATLPANGTEKPENVKEGMTIDIFAAGAAVGATPAAEARRILSVNRAASPITFTFSGAALTQTGGFITIQQSYGNEITGLGAIYDDTITTIYGVSKTANPLIKPEVVDGLGDINDALITRVLRQAERIKGSAIDMLMMGDDAYDLYVEYLRVNNIRNERTDLTITGGFKAMEFAFGKRTVHIVNEGFVPKKEAWGIDTSTLEFYQYGEWDFATQGGSAFTLIPGTAIYNALLVKYGNLICTHPGGCVRIVNAAA